jgi:prepilin-type N-terminal cleavage/methylation domain-containing protein
MNFKPYKISSTSGESGFTIIESLIAIVVVAILMVAIAPAIVFSTATRVQSKRIEIATQAAKTYIDGVKIGTITAPVQAGTGVSLNAFSAPTVGSLTCNANAYCTVPATPADNLYCIDEDGGGCTLTSNQDFVVQAFRYNANSTNVSTGYLLGVRVYRADGFRNDGSLQIAPAKQGTVTSGLGDRKIPLLEMTTEISSQTGSFNDLCNRLRNGTTGTNNTCN